MSDPTPAAAGRALAGTWKAVLPVALWLLLLLWPAPAGLPANAWHFFALFAAVILALILEPIPAAGVGLIGISAAAVFRYVDPTTAGSVNWALSGFSDATVWLIFGAFVFSTGYSKTGLGRRIALLLVRRLGSRTLGFGYAVALADLALAPGIPSNTGRSAGVLYPVLRNIPPLYGSEPGPTARRIGAYIMWVAFASSCVTSCLFLTALAPNAAALAIVKNTTRLDITWTQWFLGALPIGSVLLALVPLATYLLYPPEIKCSREIPRWAAAELEKMGPLTRQELAMILLVALALFLWIAGSNRDISLPLVGSNFIHSTAVVLVAVSLLLLTGIVGWEDIAGNKGAWNVLVWFATLVTLADGLNKVGFVGWLAQLAAQPLLGMGPMPAMALLVALFFGIHYFFASLSAHTAAVLPVVLAVGMKIPGIPVLPFSLLLVFSLGLMGVLTPYATGPAPVFYGSGYLSRADFWKLGLLFGLLFLTVLLGIGIPYLTTSTP